MKVRLSKINGDHDDVRITRFDFSKKNPEESDLDFMNRMTINHPIHGSEGGKWFGVTDYKDIDESDLPQDELLRDCWYPDLEDNGEPMIKVDFGWNKKLMSPKVIKRDIIEDCNNIIKSFFFGDVGNELAINALLKKSIASCCSEKELYQLALSGLDKRVADGKPDKVEIREKIERKIKEL